MDNSILAFSRDSVLDRRLRGDYIMNYNNVISKENMDCHATVRFDTVSIKFEQDTHRPYLMFRDGLVKCIEGDFPFGYNNIHFEGIDRNYIDVKWELTNDEYIALINDGLAGFGPSEPKAKTELQIPDVFYESDFKIPVKANVYATEIKNKDGVKIPQISCHILNQYDIVTNTEDANYKNPNIKEGIAVYFERVPQERAISKAEPVKRMELEQIWGAERINEVEDNIVHTIEVLSPSEEAELNKRTELASEIMTRVEEHHTSMIIDGLVSERNDDKLFDNDEFEKIDSDEPMSSEELEALHLVDDEDRQKAKKKIAEQNMIKAGSTQTTIEHHEKYVPSFEKEENVIEKDDDMQMSF